ncbi:MAG: type III pantothenate kinase [Saprospiraceae bacterium]|nr:type III pantothenate kinase [Saprospiraceae bacterium]
MILCIDCGNTRVKFGLFEKNDLKVNKVFSPEKTEEIFDWLDSIEFDDCILSNVGSKNTEWLDRLKDEIDIYEPDAYSNLPIKFKYGSKDSLGGDRIAAWCGSIQQMPKSNILVVNAGTCITYDLIEKENGFIGGNIAPGLNMRFRAMNHFTVRLPLIKSHQVNPGSLGTSTESAMQHGVVNGIIYELEGYFRELSSQYSDLKCIMTGGDADFIAQRTTIKPLVDQFLVLRGLNEIAHIQ